MAIDPFIQSLLDADHSLGWLGISVTHAEGGFATAELDVTPNMGNGHRVAHGGVVFALADTAFAMAANSVLQGAPTADASIVYLAPSPIGAKLIASAQVTFLDRRRAVVDVTIRSGDTTVAVYRGTARTMRPSEPEPRPEGTENRWDMSVGMPRPTADRSPARSSPTRRPDQDPVS